MSLKRFFVAAILAIILSACGIDGQPIAPDQEEDKQTLQLAPEKKLSERDPMIAEGEDNIKIISLERLDQFGRDYDGNIEGEVQELDDFFMRLKPKSAVPKEPFEEKLYPPDL
ncbi:MAG: hypothetical protein AAF621_04720 [Pseudomonadota bacterium]